MAVLGVVVLGGVAFLGVSALGSGGSASASAAPRQGAGAPTTTTKVLTSSVYKRAKTTTAAPAKKATPAKVKLAAPSTPTPRTPSGDVSLSSKLPAAIGAALIDHPLVVVSLYSAQAITGKLARDEARAGALAGGAGFVALNADSERELQLLDALLKAQPTPTKVMSDPMVVILDRSAKVYFESVGTLDQDTVAQAVANAAVGLNTASEAAPPKEPWDGYWLAKADAIICANNADMDSIVTATEAREIAKSNARARQTYAQLAALHAVGPKVPTFRLFLAKVSDGILQADRLATALRNGDVKTFNKAATAYTRANVAWLKAEHDLGVLCAESSKAP